MLVSWCINQVDEVLYSTKSLSFIEEDQDQVFYDDLIQDHSSMVLYIDVIWGKTETWNIIREQSYGAEGDPREIKM